MEKECCEMLSLGMTWLLLSQTHSCHTRSNPQDQSVFQLTALIGLSGLQKRDKIWSEEGNVLRLPEEEGKAAVGWI